jgi:hypothetical protein
LKLMHTCYTQSLVKKLSKLVVGTHGCNLSYLGGGDWEYLGSRIAQAKSS